VRGGVCRYGVVGKESRQGRVSNSGTKIDCA
jgi:hypothetical protein